MTSKRHSNYRLVKIHRSYKVEEITGLLGVHKNTVRTWIKDGLPTCDGERPIMVLGIELAEFLKARRTKNKRPCKLGEFFCFRCREPRAPAGGMADCLPVTGKIGHLQGFCPDCFCMMNRRVSFAKIEQFAAVLSITFPMDMEQVSNRTQPNANCDVEKGV